MLIIVSGVQTLNIKSIANEVFFRSNNFELEGYKFDFHASRFKITNSKGKIVYSTSFPGTDDVNTLVDSKDKKSYEADLAVFNSAKAMLNKIVLDQAENHFSTKFSEDVLLDFGCRDFSESEQQWPSLFESVIRKYNTRTNNTMVISGSFSKHVISKFKDAIGSENVKVLNIVRNPSAAFLCSLRPSEFFEETPDEKANDKKKFIRSFLIAANLKGDNAVTTIKFEDIISGNTFNFDDKEIVIPPEYEVGNEYVTKFELSDIEQHSDELTSELPVINDLFQDFNNLVVAEPGDLTEAEVDLIKSKFPKNIFTVLGYTPLTFQEITATV